VPGGRTSQTRYPRPQRATDAPRAPAEDWLRERPCAVVYLDMNVWVALAKRLKDQDLIGSGR